MRSGFSVIPQVSAYQPAGYRSRFKRADISKPISLDSLSHPELQTISLRVPIFIVQKAPQSNMCHPETHLSDELASA